MENYTANSSQSGTHPAGLNGFTQNVRSLFVATFCALILYLLLLLIKYFINAVFGKNSSYGNDEWNRSGFDAFRKRKTSRMPPPPPPTAPVTGAIPAEAGNISAMEQGLGVGPGRGMTAGYGPYNEREMSQGIESEKGTS
jgi:hypothetical protein